MRDGLTGTGITCDVSLRVLRLGAFTDVRERFANQSGCDPKALGDERVEHGLSAAKTPDCRA